MQYKSGDIVLIKFPFSSLSKAKKRPVLIIKGENEYQDFVCFQITSKSTQSHLIPIEENYITSGLLSLVSYVKYDKCFTLNAILVDKKLASLDDDFMQQIKQKFCDLL